MSEVILVKLVKYHISEVKFEIQTLQKYPRIK